MQAAAGAGEGGREFRKTLGEFEHLTLLAVFRLGKDAYPGVTSPCICAVYSTLERLAAKGLVESALNDPTPERALCASVLGAWAGSKSRAAARVFALVFAPAIGVLLALWAGAASAPAVYVVIVALDVPISALV